MHLPSLRVNLSLLADKISESSSDTLNGSKSVGDLSLSVNVGVENTENVLEFSSFFVDKTLRMLDKRLQGN